MAVGAAQDDLSLISGLFVRVGYFISHSEDTDKSETSEELEKAQMIRAIKRVENASESEIISQCAADALTIKSIPWEDENEESLMADIRHAVEFLKVRNDPTDLTQFKKALMFVGTMVARAYREETDYHTDEFMLETWLNKIVGALNRDADPENFKDTNISPAEDSALTMISEALRA